MTRDLYIPTAGMEFKVSISAKEDDVYEGYYVEEVHKVQVWDGKKYIDVKCDLESFMDDMEDLINDVLHEDLKMDAIVAAENRMDAKREEKWNE